MTLVAGRHDLITSLHDMRQRGSADPAGASCASCPGSHFLPLEYPDELAAELRRLTTRAELLAE